MFGMSEGPPKPEAEPVRSGFDALESLVKKGQWGPATEEALAHLIEKYEEDFYMAYLVYRDSGLVDELPEHERKIYEWLADAFASLERGEE